MKNVIEKMVTLWTFTMFCLLVAATFVTSTSYIQLAVGVLLYPLLVFFFFKAFPRKIIHIEPEQTLPTHYAAQTQPHAPEVMAKTNSFGISDVDKRVFLKLIGGAGLSFFLLSIFNKKAEGLFVKSLPSQGKTSLEDISGKKIDPAQHQPTDGYKISEIEDNEIAFYGFTNKDGAWFIMREDTSKGSFRYVKGTSDFPGNWGNRERLRYDYYSNVFKVS